MYNLKRHIRSVRNGFIYKVILRYLKLQQIRKLIMLYSNKVNFLFFDKYEYNYLAFSLCLIYDESNESQFSNYLILILQLNILEHQKQARLNMICVNVSRCVNYFYFSF